MTRRAIQAKMRLYTDSNRPSEAEGLWMAEPHMWLHRLALLPTSLSSLAVQAPLACLNSKSLSAAGVPAPSQGCVS